MAGGRQISFFAARDNSNLIIFDKHQPLGNLGRVDTCWSRVCWVQLDATDQGKKEKEKEKEKDAAEAQEDKGDKGENPEKPDKAEKKKEQPFGVEMAGVDPMDG